MNMRKYLTRSTIVALALALLPIVAVPSADAASNCTPPDLGKKAIGSVQVGNMVVDLTRVSYPAGGDVFPPDDARVGGVSTRHQPLTSLMGSSLIVWHDYWKGCAGSLNVLVNKKPGFKFVVTDGKGKKKVYQIAEVSTIKMGNYPKTWFSLNGPRQLIMVTCTGKLVGGHKVLNAVVRAVPVF